MRALIAALLLCFATTSIEAKPSRYRHHGPVTKFNGDRYAPVAQMSPNARDVTRAMRCSPMAGCTRAQRRRYIKPRFKRRPAPGYVSPRVVKRSNVRRVAPRTVAPRQVVKRNIYRGAAPRRAIVQHRNIFRGFAEELRNAGPSKSLAGVVTPLAAKARQIQSVCGSRIISAVRHTYIAGTGGRLSLHASGRAVDIAGNPACIYRQLQSWPGGVSTDYHRPNIRHVHVSYAPGGPEWGRRFAHGGGARKRMRYARWRG